MPDKVNSSIQSTGLQKVSDGYYAVPARNNQWFIQTSHGGKSTCIEGNLQNDGFVLPNCVGWALGRYSWLRGTTFASLSGDGGQIYNSAKSAGYSVGQEPALGAIACWSMPGDYGHVAVVEEIHPGGIIYTSNSGWNWDGRGIAYNQWVRRVSGNKSNGWTVWGGYHFQGFVYNPSIQGANVVKAFIDEAKSHVKNPPEHGAWSWKLFWKDEWCAMFVCSCANAVGILDKVIPKTAGAGTIAQLGVERGMGTWVPGPYLGSKLKPQPGDCILFAPTLPSANPYAARHVGIVVEVTDTSVITVEGNTGTWDKETSYVAKKTYSLTNTDIKGYYRPDWSKVGGTVAGLYGSLLPATLYENSNTREDALIREIGYANSKIEPSILMSNIKFSAINYTTLLESLYEFGRPAISPDPSIEGLLEITDGEDAASVDLIVKYFEAKGFNVAVGIGVAANAKHESGFNTAASGDKWNGVYHSFGLFQWNSAVGPTNDMRNYVPHWETNATGQLDFLWKQWSEGYTSMIAKFRSLSNTIESAADVAYTMCVQFERPANKEYQGTIRGDTARELFRSYTSVLHPKSI